MRVDFGHVEVDFLATRTRFFTLAGPFLDMKVSFGPLGFDFALQNIDFGPLRVNHCGHRGVCFWTPGSRFLAAECLFRAYGNLLIVEF